MTEEYYLYSINTYKSKPKQEIGYKLSKIELGFQMKKEKQIRPLRSNLSRRGGRSDALRGQKL